MDLSVHHEIHYAQEQQLVSAISHPKKLDQEKQLIDEQLYSYIEHSGLQSLYVMQSGDIMGSCESESGKVQQRYQQRVLQSFFYSLYLTFDRMATICKILLPSQKYYLPISCYSKPRNSFLRIPSPLQSHILPTLSNSYLMFVMLFHLHMNIECVLEYVHWEGK